MSKPSHVEDLNKNKVAAQALLADPGPKPVHQDRINKLSSGCSESKLPSWGI